VKGSFTNATVNKEGLLKKADGGVLVLEELGELPKDVQAKLLITIEKGQYFKVGSSEPEMIGNLAVVATTNRNRESFREDFWFRCIPFSIPPISSRRKDILYYLNLKHPKILRSLDQWELFRILLYNWPGNFREIDNTALAVNVNRKACKGGRNRVLPDLSEKIENYAIDEVWGVMQGVFQNKEELLKIRKYFLKFNLEVNGNNKERTLLSKIPRNKFSTRPSSSLKIIEENKSLEHIYRGFKNWCILFCIHWKSEDDCLYRAHRHQFDFFPIDGPDKEFLLRKNWRSTIAHRQTFFPVKEDDNKVFFRDTPKFLDTISKNLALISDKIQPNQNEPLEERVKIEKALKVSGGNMAKAAKSLGMPGTTFRTKVNDYNLIKLTKSFQGKKRK